MSLGVLELNNCQLTSVNFFHSSAVTDKNKGKKNDPLMQVRLHTCFVFLISKLAALPPSLPPSVRPSLPPSVPPSLPPSVPPSLPPSQAVTSKKSPSSRSVDRLVCPLLTRLILSHNHLSEVNQVFDTEGSAESGGEGHGNSPLTHPPPCLL